MLCRGVNRFLDEVPVPKSGNSNPSRALITEEAVETTEPGSAEWAQSRTEETRATRSESRKGTMCYHAQLASATGSG